MCSFTTTVLGLTPAARVWEPHLHLLGLQGVGWPSLPERLQELNWGQRGKEERLGLVPFALAAAAPVSSGLSPLPAAAALPGCAEGRRGGCSWVPLTVRSPAAEEYDADRILSVSPPPSINNPG